MQIICDFGNFEAILKTYASAWAGSKAGMMPSNLEHNWKVKGSIYSIATNFVNITILCFLVRNNDQLKLRGLPLHLSISKNIKIDSDYNFSVFNISHSFFESSWNRKLNIKVLFILR